MRSSSDGRYKPGMPAHLAQVCLFAAEGTAMRRFLQIVSGQMEHDDGRLVSFHMGTGPSTVAQHPPAGDLAEGDVLVTLQVSRPEAVDAVYASLRSAGLSVEDAPESTEWGWRIFYYRAAPKLVFEVGAPIP